MGLENIFQQVAGFAGSFSLKLVFFLVLVCLIGEVGLSVPYLLETVWLLSGYGVGRDVVQPLQLVVLWLAAQAGRQAGARLLYQGCRVGSGPLVRVWRRLDKSGSSASELAAARPQHRFFRLAGHLSPFSVAYCRLIGLRFPVTVALAVRGQSRRLALGVVLSSVAWDGIYLLLGVGGASAVLAPAQMVTYSLTGLSVLYVATWGVRRVLRWRRARPV